MAGWAQLLKATSSVVAKVTNGMKVAFPYVKNAAVEAGKSVVAGIKVAVPQVKNAVKEGAHAAKGVGEFVGKHPVVSTVSLGVALPHLGYKDGLLNFGFETLGGQKAKESGALSYGSTLLLGESKDAEGNEKSIIAKAGEALIGKDSYEDVKQGAVNAVDGVRNLYQDGRQVVGGLFQGNGMVANGQGYYQDPTNPVYPDMSQMLGQAQGNNLMGSLMGGMNNAVNAISGGNVSKLNIAGLLLSAYMMFGRFGWLGKAASLMLGGMTLNNINNRQQPVYQQGQGYPMAQAAPRQAAISVEQPVERDEDVILRSRGI